MRHRLFAARQVLSRIALPLLAAVITCGTCQASVFRADGRALLLDEAPFTVRGVCYSPTPIGGRGDSYPYGDYYTAAYLPLIERDLVNLRRMGCNVIRVYGWAIGADHSAFLDLCYNDGQQPIYVLINRWIDPATNWTSTQALNALSTDWTAIATEAADHPAVMGMILGNEANMVNGNGDNPAFWQAMNALASTVKANAPDKLVGVAITDALPQVGTYNSVLPALDFWGIQVYRGTGFYGFFADYANRSSKPLIITEFGFDAFNSKTGMEYPDAAAFSADVVENLIVEARQANSICSGVCVFEYNDEWWKTAGSNVLHDTGGFPSGAFPDGMMNEEWWGIFSTADNGSAPDLVHPRALFYRLAAYWRQPASPDTVASLAPAGIALMGTYDADLRDMPARIERSDDLLTWTTLVEGPGGLSLTPSIAGVNVESTLSSDGRTLLVEVSDSAPATSGPALFYRIALDAR